MSFKFFKFIQDSPSFDLKELVRHSIDSAVTLNSTARNKNQTAFGESDHEQELSEIILFVLESMQTDPGCISPSDLVRLVESVCHTVLQQSHVHIHGQGQQRSHNEGLKHSVYKLYAALLRTCGGRTDYQELKSRIQQDCIQGLCYYSEEQRLQVNLTSADHDDGKTLHPAKLAVKDILGVLDYVFRSIQPRDAEGISDSWLEDCFQTLLDVLEFSEPTTCSHVSGILLPKLLQSSRQPEKQLSAIWRRLLNVHQSPADRSSQQASNVYVALCGLSDFFLPLQTSSVSEKPTYQADDSSGILADDAFWRVIQTGLTHADPLSRKQTCFLMKRAIETASASNMIIPETASSPPDPAASKNESSDSGMGRCEEQLEGSRLSENACLFWWSPESQRDLLAMWADFFLMYETLDEVQVHVVRPVMPRMTSLIQAASFGQSGSARPLLHASWLTILFARCFVHETKTVIQWGLLQFLRLDLGVCPLLQQVGKEFFFDRVFPVLNDDSMYATQSSGVGVALSPVPGALTQFTRNCVQTLGTPQSEVFLRDLLLAVSRQSWSPVSLTFVFDMLTNLPECRAWGSNELQVLREMQFTCVGMLSSSYRSIVQCLMLQAVLRLLDTDRTSLHQLSGLLGLFGKCLHRGSPLWKQVCEWFQCNKHTQLFGVGGDLANVLRSEVAAMLTFDPSVSSRAAADLGDMSEPSRVACMVIVAADSHYANTSSSNPSSHQGDEKSFLRCVLSPMVSVLATVGSHIYLPIVKADTSLQLLCGILTLLNRSGVNGETTGPDSDQVRQEMTVVLTSCLEEISAFIFRRLLSPDLAKSTDVSRVSLYMAVLEAVSTFSTGSPRCSGLRVALRSGQARMVEGCKMLAKRSEEMAQNDVLLSKFHAFVASRLLLWFLQSPGADGALQLPWDALLPVVTVPDDSPTAKAKSEASTSTNLRKISNHVLCTKWQCISELLRAGSATGTLPLTGPPDAMLAACVRDLTLVKGSDAIPIMQCAKVLAKEVCQGAIPLCVDLVSETWSAVQDEWKGKAQRFWGLYTAAIQLIFQPCFLEAAPGTQMHDALDKVISCILTLGEGKPKIVAVFAKHLSDEWGGRLDGEDLAQTLSAVANHLSPLMDMCIMGSRISRDIKLQQDICVHLLGLPYLQAISDDILACSEQRPGQRRVILLNFLLLVATTGSSEACQLVTDFVQGLLTKFLEMKTTTRRGYTMNTQLHRQNVRLWQAVLVLIPYIRRDCVSQVLESVLGSVVREKQSSVRYLMVWVAVQLVRLEPSTEVLIWDHVQTMSDSPDCNVCPLLMLISHLGMVQSDVHSKECFYRRAFPVLLPWALVQTSSIRHIGLLCVKKVWQDCSKEGLGSLLESFPVLRACIEFLQDRIPATQSQHKVDSNFFLFKVHPVQDYTIQTVFHILPALSSLVDDEFLEPKLFERDSPSLWRGGSQPRGRTPTMSLYNQDDSPIQEQYRRFMSVAHASTQGSQDGGQMMSTSPESGDNESNVQKKVIPWQDAAMPGFEDVLGTGRDDEEQPSKAGSLVLVASLIDKAPNLGGLCRTSQIFGVSTLVVNSLRVTADKIFQSLSVTAEKWLPITEVQVSDLAAYLQVMRHTGFTLVGVEQTARSLCLTKYQFPEKTLLLLGHERTGIPVELIQLLDVCVEIPQQGIIRSLNVHVSGALLVWEYTRQRLLAQMTKE